ncbi:aldo/keto reductase [Acidocella aquatica]|uniref:Aldo/keto reductase n=1 Tax=Acidocella aquatica TaxID=1922313 RepID=A0ABQ6A5K9_9PROT|nr:aldo/keto reductase [Acidocella aquatica]GLR66151.1 aldo/keto reductase [Acidocella aquatica]
MRTRKIGAFEVTEIGLGCMSLSHAYGAPPSRAVAESLLLAAIDEGVTHFDTAALYGFGRNEQLVGEVLQPYRKRIMLASKCGMTGVDGKRVIDGRPATLKATCEASLKNLRTDVIDLYYLHRWDRTVPIEESVGALADLVAAGKIRTIGLSEVSAQTLRKAHAVHPIAAVQTEYSLWTRNPEYAVLGACEELGVSLVAFSPVGRGFLAGGVTDTSLLMEGDIRRGMPRFQAPQFEKNLGLLPGLAEMAKEVGATMGQLALAWVLSRSACIVPIPGTTSVAHLRENVAVSGVVLTQAQLERLGRIISPVNVAGARYPAATNVEIDTEDAPPEV